MIIDICDLQDRVQDSMLDRLILEHEIELAINIVHEKVAVLVYCIQRIEYAIKSAQNWSGNNDHDINKIITQWLDETCATADLDKLCGIEVVASRQDSCDQPIKLCTELIYNECPHFVFPSENAIDKTKENESVHEQVITA